jgi:hypothetical protein
METDYVQAVSKKLLEQLPMILNGTNKNQMQYKLLQCGVVHTCPVKVKSQPRPGVTRWRRDGCSLFESALPHEVHCFNVISPLVQLSSESGSHEFILGSHDDKVFEHVVREISQEPNGHKLALRADLDVGSMIIADIRVFYRGMDNASNIDAQCFP